MKSADITFIVDKNGKRTGVLIRKDEFEKLMDTLENFKDLSLAYALRSKNLKTISYEKVRKELLSDAAKK